VHVDPVKPGAQVQTLPLPPLELAAQAREAEPEASHPQAPQEGGLLTLPPPLASSKVEEHWSHLVPLHVGRHVHAPLLSQALETEPYEVQLHEVHPSNSELLKA